jgi:hypothetical protein
VFTPPETFAQLRSAQWLLPGCLVLGAFLWMAGAGSRLPTIVQVVLPLAVMGWLLAQWMIWLSVFGTYATLFVLLIMLLFATLPFSVALLPHVLPEGYQWVMALVALLHLAVLLVATHRQWRNLQLAMKQGAEVLSGVVCRVHLSSQRIESTRITDETQLSIGANRGLWGGAASVMAYPILRHWLGNEALLAVCSCMGFVVAVWLHVTVAARWLAMSGLLMSMERQTGHRFVPSQLEWLESQRQAHWLGRFLRRVWPCPVPLNTKVS